MIEGRIEKKQFEFYWNFFAILILTGGLDALLSAGGGRSEGNLLYQALMVFFTFPCIFMFLKKGFRAVFDRLFDALPLVCIIAFCAVSAIWSQEPLLTLRRTAALFIGFSYALYLVDKYKTRNLIQLIYAFLVALLVISIIAALFFGGIHEVEKHEGAWHGFAGHKIL